MRKFLLMLGAALIAACSACSSTPSSVVPNTITSVEIALTAAEKAALIYKRLQTCPTPRSAVFMLCSDPAMVQKILDADNKAYAAVVAARSNAALIGTAVGLIEAFTAIIPAQGS